MCGISGIVSFSKKNVEENQVRKMMSSMKHRGPNDDGVFIENKICLGFVRLSIIDLSSAGHQPFQSEDGRYVMVFNGEIFNYLEIKEELKSLGHKFNTRTDTEVLLHAYMQWGKDCLHRLNGMWAIAIYDKVQNTLFIARDRFGVKPLYYYINNGMLFFASEIPSILAVLPQKPIANEQTIFDYVVFNKTEQSSDTFFDGIKKLMHGHCVLMDLKKTSQNPDMCIEKWYDIKVKVKEAQPFRNSSEFRDLFTSSVKLRLRSDVPVGVCLSGGLDSSTIASIIMDDLKKDDLNTFSAVYDETFDRDESAFIKLYENKPGDRHYVTPSAETLIEDIDDFIACHAEPLPTTGPYAQYKVMQLASKNVVVTLDGQGADEELAGYHYFFGFYYKDLLKNFKIWSLLKEIYYYVKIHKSTFALKTFLFFLLPKSIRTKVKVSEFGYINKSFVEKYAANNIISDKLYASSSLQEALINHFEYKLEHLLKWEDRNSMFFSIEARVPFLDFRVVERTLATPLTMIIRNGMTKHILREAMIGLLPEAIRMRVDKNGFMTPQDEWFRTPQWQEKIWSIVKSESFAKRGIMNPGKVIELYQKHLNREIQIAREIWKWIHLELWYRKYID